MFQVTLDKFQSVFDIFNNTKMDIIELGDYDDYENVYYGNKVIGTINGDLQPYSGEMAQREYGLSIECQYAFYCHNDDRIKEGVYFTEGGKTYQVAYSALWDMGCAALLREVDLSGRCE